MCLPVKKVHSHAKKKNTWPCINVRILVNKVYSHAKKKYMLVYTIRVSSTWQVMLFWETCTPIISCHHHHHPHVYDNNRKLIFCWWWRYWSHCDYKSRLTKYPCNYIDNRSDEPCKKFKPNINLELHFYKWINVKVI